MKNQNKIQNIIALLAICALIFGTPAFARLRLLSENDTTPQDRPIPLRHQRNARVHSLNVRKRRCLPNDNLFTNMYHEDCGFNNLNQMCASPILPHCAPTGKCATAEQINLLYSNRDRIWKKYDFHHLPDTYKIAGDEGEKECKTGTFVGPRFDTEESHNRYWVGSAVAGKKGQNGLGTVATWKNGEVVEHQYPICKESRYHSYPAVECTSDRSTPMVYNNISFTGCDSRRYPYWGAWMMCDRLEKWDCMHDDATNTYFCGNKQRETAEPLVFNSCEPATEFLHMNKNNVKCYIEEDGEVVESYTFEMEIISMAIPDVNTLIITDITPYIHDNQNEQHYV